MSIIILSSYTSIRTRCFESGSTLLPKWAWCLPVLIISFIFYWDGKKSLAFTYSALTRYLASSYPWCLESDRNYYLKKSAVVYNVYVTPSSLNYYSSTFLTTLGPANISFCLLLSYKCDKSVLKELDRLFFILTCVIFFSKFIFSCLYTSNSIL